jgi:hypothetical protein
MNTIWSRRTGRGPEQRLRSPRRHRTRPWSSWACGTRSGARQHLLNEAGTLLLALPVEIREALPRTKEVRPRLQGLASAYPQPS